MKKLLLLLIIPFLSFGQGWIQSYSPGDAGKHAIQRNDGGYALIGNADYEVYFNITGENGDVIAEQILNDYQYIQGYCLQQTSDNGYVIIGNRANVNTGFLYKFDDNGNVEWLLSNSDIGKYYITENSDGSYITVGSSLTKIDSDGNVIWTNPNISGWEVIQTMDNGFAVANTSCTADNDNDGICEGKLIEIIKTNNDGTPQWTYEYLANDELWEDQWYSVNGASIQETNEGGYITIMNYTYEYFGNERYGFHLIKLDADGTVEWFQNFSETNSSYSVNRVRLTSDNGYIVVGGHANNDGVGLWIMKTDEYGSQQWSQTYYDSSSGGYGYSIEQTDDEGYVVGGFIEGEEFVDLYGILMLKTDSEGNINSTNIIETPTIKKNLITKIDILGRETSNNKGFQLYIYDDGSVEKRYKIE
tara:strand:- start:1983 stop:3233 length:1251 start_codon:yes stop_codon:yes gene_type:complete